LNFNGYNSTGFLIEIDLINNVNFLLLMMVRKKE